jgi:hypothetical protein
VASAALGTPRVDWSAADDALAVLKVSRALPPVVAV